MLHGVMCGSAIHRITRLCKDILHSTHVKVMAIVGSSLNGARHSMLTSCCACAPASIVEAIGFGCNFILEDYVKKMSLNAQEIKI